MRGQHIETSIESGLGRRRLGMDVVVHAKGLRRAKWPSRFQRL